MKRRYKNFTQSDFAARFKSLDQPKVSKLLNGVKKVWLNLAVELAEQFTEKDILQWKNATTEEIRDLYKRLEKGVSVDAG